MLIFFVHVHWILVFFYLWFTFLHYTLSNKEFSNMFNYFNIKFVKLTIMGNWFEKKHSNPYKNGYLKFYTSLSNVVSEMCQVQNT